MTVFYLILYFNKMPLVNKTPDYVELYLATQYTDGDTTLDCYAKNNIYKLTDQKTDSLVTSFRCVGISRNNADSWMGMAVSNVVENGTFQGNTRYTMTLRTSDGANPMVGLANTDDGTNSDANIITANKLDSLPSDSLLMVAVGSSGFTELYNSLTGISGTATAEAGEDFAASIFSVSLHTDGKLYKYHATNYPNITGITDGNAYSSGATATYFQTGGLSTGHAGLTVGATQYAEETGAITETSSATTRPIGQAMTATTVKVSIPVPTAEEASQAESEAGTIQGKYMSPLRTAQQIAADTTIIKTIGAQSVADVKTFTSSPIVPAPTTDLQAATKKYVDENSPISIDLQTMVNVGGGSQSTTGVAVTNGVATIGGAPEYNSGFFTAQESGYYLINWGGKINSIFNETSSLSLLVDGATKQSVSFGSSGTTGQSLSSDCSSSIIIYLTVGQEVKLVPTLASGTDVSNVHFNILRIR